MQTFRSDEPSYEGGNPIRRGTKLTVGFMLVGVLAIPLFAADEEKKTWNFDNDQTGTIARGFTNETGQWRVVDSDEPS
jgi:hypothetical protein